MQKGTTKCPSIFAKGLKMILASVTFMFAALPIFAQEESSQILINDSLLPSVRIVIYLLVFILALVLYITLMIAVKDASVLSWQFIVDSITSKNSKDEMMDHSYDGIRELDNRMPGWLQVIFYSSIVFAVVYMFHYHVFGTGDLQIAEYKSELSIAAEKYKDVELPEDAIVVITNETRLINGEEIYQSKCKACHGSQGQGGIGPNMADAYWLHGGSIKDLYKTITQGVPSKGMISWKTSLTPMDRLDVASFILTMGGTNPPDAKDPEGDLYDPDASLGGQENVEEIIPNDSTATE